MNLKETSDGLCVGRKFPAHQCMHVCIQIDNTADSWRYSVAHNACIHPLQHVITQVSIYVTTKRPCAHATFYRDTKKFTHKPANCMPTCTIINHLQYSKYTVCLRTKVVKGVGFIYFLSNFCMHRRGRLSLK